MMNNDEAIELHCHSLLEQRACRETEKKNCRPFFLFFRQPLPSNWLWLYLDEEQVFELILYSTLAQLKSFETWTEKGEENKKRNKI